MLFRVRGIHGTCRTVCPPTRCMFKSRLGLSTLLGRKRGTRRLAELSGVISAYDMNVHMDSSGSSSNAFASSFLLSAEFVQCRCRK